MTMATGSDFPANLGKSNEAKRVGGGVWWGGGGGVAADLDR